MDTTNQELTQNRRIDNGSTKKGRPCGTYIWAFYEFSSGDLLAFPSPKLWRSPPLVFSKRRPFHHSFGDMWVWVKTLVPLVNPKIAGKWMFIPPKNVFIGIDPYPCVRICQDPSLCITFSSCLDLPFLAFEKSPYFWHVEMILSSRPKPGFLSCFLITNKDKVMNYQWTICLIKSIQITHYNIPKVSKSDFFFSYGYYL